MPVEFRKMKYTSQRDRRSCKSFSSSKEDKKSTKKTVFYIRFYIQAVDFETTNKFIINYIKKTYAYGNNISELLRSLTIANTKK